MVTSSHSHEIHLSQRDGEQVYSDWLILQHVLPRYMGLFFEIHNDEVSSKKQILVFRYDHCSMKLFLYCIVVKCIRIMMYKY